MDLNIRNVINGDFMEIARLAENCGPMSTMPNAVYHLFTRHFKKTSFVVEDNVNHKILGFLLGFISQNNQEEGYIHLLCLDYNVRVLELEKILLTGLKKLYQRRDVKKLYL